MTSSKAQLACHSLLCYHYSDVIMGTIASQMTSLTVVYSSFIQAQIKVNIKAPRHWPLCGEFTGGRGIPAKRPVTRKMFPFDDVIMTRIHFWRNMALLWPILFNSFPKHIISCHQRRNWDRDAVSLHMARSFNRFSWCYICTGMNNNCRH